MNFPLDISLDQQQQLIAEARRRGILPTALLRHIISTGLAQLPVPPKHLVVPSLTPDSDTVSAALAALPALPAPQILADLKPRRPLPTGSNGMEFVIGQWPGTETEEELLAALEAMK